MARKTNKKRPPIMVNDLEEVHIIEKSRPLMLMKEVPFALGELKVLDTYLSRINARDPDYTTVRFSKEEYESLMGIERMRPERLGKYIDSLMGKVITVPNPTNPDKWKKYTLFEASECSQDENEQWWIDLTCTRAAKKLFFNLEGIGYIRYQLKNVLPLTSKYSVLLYIYLLDNRFRGSWDIVLPELREKILRCNSDFYADNFKEFRRDILEKALKEVNEKTDLTFHYEPIKAGRKVTKIKFILIKDESTLPLEEDPNQLSLFNHEFEDFDKVSEFDLDFYGEMLPDGLTDEQIEHLRSLAAQQIPWEPGEEMHDREMKVAHYLLSKTKLMKTQSPPVKHPFRWLCRAVEEDWK